MFRIKLWLTRPLICAFGFHKFDWNEWGSSPCSGQVDFYCHRCQKKIKTIPLDDLPQKYREHIRTIFDDGRKNEGGERCIF